MKNLQSIGIKNFKDGMYSSDATELIGKAILLENIVHDDKLGKAIKVSDYALTQLSEWGNAYFGDSVTGYIIGDMVFFSPEEDVEYLTVAVITETFLGVYSFLVGSDESLTFTPDISPIINEPVSNVTLSVAGKVLRIAYETTYGVKVVKWYGEIKSKEMFFIDGVAQHSVNGFVLESAKPDSKAIYFGTHSLGDVVEANSDGALPDDASYVAPSVEYYKSYKISAQVDDSQESEFADLLVATEKTSKEVIIPINIDPGFSSRLSKIHIWRRVSSDPIEYNDAHELIKTLDISKSEKSSTIIEDNMIPMTDVMLAVDYAVGYQESVDAVVYQRVLVEIPESFFQNGSNVYSSIFIYTMIAGSPDVYYYWKSTKVGPDYAEFTYYGSTEANVDAQNIPSGALLIAGTYDVRTDLAFTTGIAPPAGGIGSIEITDASFQNVFVQDSFPLTPNAHIGSDLRASESVTIPDSEITGNSISVIQTDTALCTYKDNPNAPFSIIGTSEVIAQFEENPLKVGGFTYQFTDSRPFEYGSGLFYSEDIGLIRGDFPLYSKALKYDNRLFVIDGATVRWSEVFKYDMFLPESIYTGKNDYTHLVIFRDVLFVFSENDVVVLNYAGTTVNWRTSDTLDDIGTKYTHTIKSTPVGIFFTDGKAIYVLASTMQMGKQSYTEYQRIDEPIEDQFDFSSVAVENLIGHYDIKKSRYVLSNSEDGTQYIFSVNGKGWFLRKSSAYPSILRSLGKYGLINDASGQSYFTKFVDSTPTSDYCYITTGYFFVGDPHNETWFRDVFALLKNGVVNKFDTTTYYAKIVLIHDETAVADWDLGDIDNQSPKYNTLLEFIEDIMKINAKLKKFKLKIYSNYPIFEYDNLQITYTPTGTY